MFKLSKFYAKQSAMDDLLGASGGSIPEPVIKEEIITPENLGTEEIIEDTSATDDLSTKIKLMEAEKKLMQDELENKLKEAREDAAKRRMQNKVLKEQATELFSKEKELYAKEIAELKKQADELAALKKKDAISEKGIGEQLELTRLEIESKNKELLKTQKKADEAQSKLQEFLDQQKETEEIQNKVLDEKIAEELAKIPEGKRKFAELIVKGEGSDKKAGLYALLEAKNDNLFGVKKVEVIHQVPRNSETTNTNKVLTSKGKISSGLRTIQGNGHLRPGQRII